MALQERKKSSREDGGFRMRSEKERSHMKALIFMELMSAKRMRDGMWMWSTVLAAYMFR